MRSRGPRALLAMANEGGELLVRHGGREELVTVRRLLRDGAEMHVVQFARPVVEGSWPGLMLILGAQFEPPSRSCGDQPDPHCAYIAYLRAVRGWSGTQVLVLAVALSRAVGMRRVRVHDNAKVAVPCNARARTSAKDLQGWCDAHLSPMLLLSRAITFYGRLGFLPVPRGLEEHEDARAYARAICRAHREASRATVGEFRDYLGGLIRSARRAGVTHELRFRAAGADYVLRIPVDVALKWWQEEGGGRTVAGVISVLKGIPDHTKLVDAVEGRADQPMIRALCLGHRNPYWAKRVSGSSGFNTLVSSAYGKTIAEWPYGAAFATLLSCTDAAFELDLTDAKSTTTTRRMNSFCDV